MSVIKGTFRSVVRGGQWPPNDLVAVNTAGYWVSGENEVTIDSVDSNYSGYILVDVGIGVYIDAEDNQYTSYIEAQVPIMAYHYGEDTEYTCYISGAIYTPDISFNGTPRQGVRPLTVTFTDTTTYPAGYSGVWRRWNFGDPYGVDNILEGSGVYETVTHSYPINGVYNVELQVKMCKIP